MKKTVLFLVLTLALVLSACSNNSGNKSNNENDSKDTVSIKIAFQQVEMTKVVMRIKISNTVKVPKNPKNAVVLDYGALDVLKEMGVADKVKGLPKGENNESLPSF